MSNIYDQHKAAFANVSAYCVVDKVGNRIASIAFKFPRDGAGRLYCYVHVYGGPMVRGFAGGYGYDKRSAAALEAIAKIKPDDYYPEDAHHVAAFKRLVDCGSDWERQLCDAGYTVLQAV